MKVKYPIKFSCDEFDIQLIGVSGSKKLGYIRFENNKVYVGSIDMDTSKGQLEKLRDALNVLIEQKGKK